MIDIYNKEEFTEHYHQEKSKGKTDGEIAKGLYVDRYYFKVLRDIHEVESILIRKNELDVTEADFRKGAKMGLDRRIILRRVRDGMHVNLATTTPRKKCDRSKNK